MFWYLRFLNCQESNRMLKKARYNLVYCFVLIADERLDQICIWHWRTLAASYYRMLLWCMYILKLHLFLNYREIVGFMIFIDFIDNFIVFHRSAYYDSLYANNENQTEIYLNLFNILKFYYVIRSVLSFKALTRRIRGCDGGRSVALASNHDNY